MFESTTMHSFVFHSVLKFIPFIFLFDVDHRSCGEAAMVLFLGDGANCFIRANLASAGIESVKSLSANAVLSSRLNLYRVIQNCFVSSEIKCCFV